MRVKICGITRPEDAEFAERQGADAIGVVVFSGGVSRRVVWRKRHARSLILSALSRQQSQYSILIP